jgi:chromosome segregation ATPase
MKSFEEKEKKLETAISKLNNVNFSLNDLKFTISDLEEQKNQLIIEKNQIEVKYSSLIKEHRILKKQVEKFNTENTTRFEDKSEFSKKIDELNQETDSLIEEIDKWQM